MRRTIASVLALALTATTVTCAPPTSPFELAGTYTLLTVNGAPLPYLFPPDGPAMVEALDDQYILMPQGTFTEAGHKRITSGGIATLTFPVDAGTFTRRGDAVTFESPLFGTRTGTIIRGRLTLVQGAFSLAYAK